MPLREPTSFSPLAVIAIATSSGHSAAPSSGSAKLSAPSGARPACISTKPPNSDRAAEPEPRRASTLSSRGGSFRSRAPAAAITSAAKPDAEDARPAPVGKLFELVDARARTDARALAKQVEACGNLRELIGAAPAVERELVGGEPIVELDFGVRPQRIERDRDRADRGHVEPRVGLAPVLHEREIGARPSARAPAARRLLRSSHGS